LNLINLFKLRHIITIIFPLYISICGVLILDVKSNLKCDFTSILYFIGLASFFIACFISSKLCNICNTIENVYITELNDYIKGDQSGTIPEREQIYKKLDKKIENKASKYIVFIFFSVLGFLCVYYSHISQKDESQKIANQKIIQQQQIDLLQHKIDSLQSQINSIKVIYIEQADELILE